MNASLRVLLPGLAAGAVIAVVCVHLVVLRLAAVRRILASESIVMWLDLFLALNAPHL